MTRPGQEMNPSIEMKDITRELQSAHTHVTSTRRVGREEKKKTVL